jgi:gamma-glutamylcysteine synthetase
MPKDLNSEPALRPAVLELMARPRGVEDDEIDDALFLAELRSIVEGARTPGEDLLRQYHPDWEDRLGRIYARYAD